MTKVWEEEWTFRTVEGHSGALCFPDGGEALVKYDPARYARGVGIQRGKLAAAAPELVRVLLAMYMAHDDCPSCRVPMSWTGPPKGCKPDCALDAALRKAGVREPRYCPHDVMIGVRCAQCEGG